MEGNYPWEGKVTLSIDPEQKTSFKLFIRIPSWITDNPLPESDLYTYGKSVDGHIDFLVNGEPVSKYKKMKRGRERERDWKVGDKVTINMPMPVRYVCSNQQSILDDNIGKIGDRTRTDCLLKPRKWTMVNWKGRVFLCLQHLPVNMKEVN
ncbi:MAG: hypothetical protein ACLVEJ_05735 [Parabacteroides sp.]